MTDDKFDMDAILAQMNDKFIETAQEKLVRLNEILEELPGSGQNRAALVEEFHREIHSLKGLGGTFQMPLVTKICHMFEDYLASTSDFSESLIVDCYSYLDRLNDVIASGHSADEKEAAEWLADLPDKKGDTTVSQKTGAPKVLFVISSDQLRDEIAPLFRDNGFDVIESSSAFRAYKAAVQQKPRVIVVSQQLGEMDGAELLRSFSGMRQMSQTQMAMICPDRRQALSENLQRVQLLSEKNAVNDVMNFIALIVSA